MPRERSIYLGPRTASPQLSVLIPFYCYDASDTLTRMANAPAGVEFVLLDDGSRDIALLARVVEAARELHAQTRIIVSEDNCGRAAARNRLIAEARGQYVLFLDADMLPDRPTFLLHWLSVTRCQQPDVAFGGLSLRHAKRTRDTALHHNLFGASDCLSLEERQLAPAQTTASANLLVRRSFLETHPFDASFSGWGFEDTDWALSAERDTAILHIDNPATHAGLDSAATLLRKSAEAGPNFARLAAKHPHAAKRFAAHRAARALQLTPLRPQLARACAWLARDPVRATPMPLRRAALKLYRAAHYAEYLA
ncbi:MAG: glycosyltransferase family 2 protein [Hyphomonadaceae bacterium]|nr:glycosyltransferase family 2 protein [Hyphomonadaceae bacterium]